MSERESIFIKELKKWLIGSALVLLTSAVAFYYNTQNSIKEHDKRIEKLENNSYSREMVDVKLNLILNEVAFIKQEIKELKQK